MNTQIILNTSTCLSTIAHGSCKQVLHITLTFAREVSFHILGCKWWAIPVR